MKPTEDTVLKLGKLYRTTTELRGLPVSKQRVYFVSIPPNSILLCTKSERLVSEIHGDFMVGQFLFEEEHIELSISINRKPAWHIRMLGWLEELC